MAIESWKPISQPQEEFLAIPESVREGFFGGSAGPGKSEILMMYPIVRKYYEKSRFKALFMRRTYSELKLEIIPRSRELYEAVGGKFNKSDLCWDFDGAGLIFFGHCEHEDDVHKYDSMEINLFLPDELQTFLEYQYMYLAFTRVRSSVPDLPAIVRAAGMPGDIGHTWVKKRFIDPCPEGGKLLIGRGGNQRIFISSTLVDNPKINQAYAQGLEQLPEAEKRAKKYGDWSAYEGQVFDEFRDLHYPEEPENAIHVVEPFDIPDYWPKVMSIDWGFAPPAMTYVLFGAISPNRRLYCYRELAWQKKKISEWAPYVKEFVDIENPKIIKLCKSASQDRGQEHTILEQISASLGRNIELSSNNAGTRIAGKMLLHEYLRWQPVYVPAKAQLKYSDETAAWILRNKGMADYNGYLSLFNQAPAEDNIPKLQMFNCPLLVNSIKAAVYSKTNPQDIAEFPGDDPLDTIRYLLDAADSYFNLSESEFKKVEKEQALLKYLQSTGDQTGYYRNARRLEATMNTNPAGIRRYHRSRRVY